MKYFVYMIFVDHLGNVIEIKRSDFISDNDYYRTILNVKGYNVNKVEDKAQNRICESLDKYIKQ